MLLLHKYYLLYLLSIPDISFDVIKELCVENDLTEPEDAELTQLNDSLTPPKNYNPKKLTKPTRDWLKSHKIYDMWKGTKPASKAVELLKLPQTREAVEYIILAKLPLEEFKHKLPSSITPSVVSTYKHYFLNTSLLSSETLKQYIKLRGGLLRSLALCTNSKLAKSLFDFVTDGVDASVPTGALSRRVLDILALRILQIQYDEPSPQDAAMLRSYAKALQTGQDIFKESGQASENLLDLFTQIELDVDSSEPKTLKQLTQGEDSD